MTLIADCQYFSPVIFFKTAVNFSNIKIDVYDYHRKMTYRNRCVVAGANGPIILSVPLEEGRDQKRPVKEVRIAPGTGWQGQHWKTIESCYNRSPWFEFYREELEPFYRQNWYWLADWNMACAEWIFGKLGHKADISRTDSFRAVYGEPGYLDWRNKLLPKSIQTDFPDPVRYKQVFEERLGFIPHLSVLDLLFCEGKNAPAKLSGEGVTG